MKSFREPCGCGAEDCRECFPGLRYSSLKKEETFDMDTANSTLALRRKLAVLESRATRRRENLEDLVHSARFVVPRPAPSFPEPFQADPELFSELATADEDSVLEDAYFEAAMQEGVCPYCDEELDADRVCPACLIEFRGKAGNGIR